MGRMVRSAGWCAPPAQALEAGKTAQSRRCYYDFADMLRTNPSGNVPYTPSLPLLYGLKKSLQLLSSEGMANVVARHHRCAPPLGGAG
jgi:alanine-glyoxylate transaminase/serine-glyoxylate transaminase/serine-pyruvate transaminase